MKGAVLEGETVTSSDVFSPPLIFPSSLCLYLALASHIWLSLAGGHPAGLKHSQIQNQISSKPPPTPPPTSATWFCACSNSPSLCMWTVPPRSWPLTSATPGKSRGRAFGRPSGSWCRLFPGPGWWSQVQSGRRRSPAAPGGSPAPSRWDGSGLFHRRRWLWKTRRGSQIAVSCGDGGRLRERCNGLGGWPRRVTRSHTLTQWEGKEDNMFQCRYWRFKLQNPWWTCCRQQWRDNSPPELSHVNFSWQAKQRVTRKGRDLDNTGPSEVSAPCLTWCFTTPFFFPFLLQLKLDDCRS